MDACNQPRRVLVVEDEAAVRDMIVDVLIEDGFDVHAVASAREALLHLGAQWPVDVLFTDIDLAGELDGIRLAQLARKVRPDLALVITSGRERSLDEIPSGAVFVTKPYEPGEICALLTRVTQRRRRSYSSSPPLARNASSQWI